MVEDDSDSGILLTIFSFRLSLDVMLILISKYNVDTVCVLIKDLLDVDMNLLITMIIDYAVYALCCDVMVEYR